MDALSLNDPAPAAATRPADRRKPPALPPRRSFCIWAFLWAIIVLYYSLLNAPAGFHMRLLSPAAAWSLFLDTPYLLDDPFTRPDLMGNFLVLIPLGFLLAGALWPRRNGMLRLPAPLLAALLCAAFIGFAKYAQEFFPPRAVTLNQLLAQLFGAATGIGFWAIGRLAIAIPDQPIRLRRDTGTTLVLVFYAAAFVLFCLMPMDFVLRRAELVHRLVTLWHAPLSIPGVGRPFPIRLLLMVGEVAQTVPIGALLARRCREWPFWRYGAAALIATGLLNCGQILVLSATPHLVAIPDRTFGFLFGAALMRGAGQDFGRGAGVLMRTVPMLAIPYLLMLLSGHQLIAPEWRTAEQAYAAFHFVMPFWNHYMVSKSHALSSIFLEAVSYAPIGAMVWLRCGVRRGALSGAVALAACLALAIEVARVFRPGLEPDLSNVFIAGAAAWFAFKLAALAMALSPERARALRELPPADETAMEPPRPRMQLKDAPAVF